MHSFTRLRSCIQRASIALVLVMLGFSASAVEPTDWKKVSTDNIIMYTDYNTETALKAIEDLELFRMTVLQFMKGVEVENLPQVTVYMFETDKMWKNLGMKDYVGGFFRNPIYGPQMFVRSRDGKAALDVVFHEYVHYLVMTNVPIRFANWYNEGIAEFFSTLVIGDDYVFIGAVPKDRAETLSKRGFIKPEELFKSVRGVNKGWRYWAKYYASAWLTTHYFTLGARNGFPSYYQANAKFLNLINQGVDVDAAYSQSFPISYSELNSEVLAYARSKSKDGFAIDKPQLNAKTTIKTLSAVEAKSVLARAFGWRNAEGLGYTYLTEAAEANDPFAMSVMAVRAGVQKDKERLLDYLGRIEKAQVLDKNVTHNLGNAYMHLAGMARQEDDIEAARNHRSKAKDYFEFSINQNGYLPSYLALIRFYDRAGLMGDARNTVEQMLAFAPNHYRARITAAQFYIDVKEYITALEHVEAATSLAGHDDSVMEELLELFEKIKSNSKSSSE